MATSRSSSYLSLNAVKAFEPLAARKGVSEVARSSRGFLTAYKRVNGNPDALPEEWASKRDAFVARHGEQMKGERLFDTNGFPSRRHLALIMWASSPATDEALEESLWRMREGE